MLRESLRDALVAEVDAPRWALSLTAMGVILVWTLNYHKQQLVTAQEINARSVTVGDYTVAVSGLDAASGDASRDELPRTWRTTAKSPRWCSRRT